eukprot:COSAG04_NODE_338_length_16370_cov_18.584230_13_plen_212_part_00
MRAAARPMRLQLAKVPQRNSTGATFPPSTRPTRISLSLFFAIDRRLFAPDPVWRLNLGRACAQSRPGARTWASSRGGRTRSARSRRPSSPATPPPRTLPIRGLAAGCWVRWALGSGGRGGAGGGGGGGARAPRVVGLQAEAATPSVALSGAVRARSWQKGKTDGTVNMIATAFTITAFCLIVSGPGRLRRSLCGSATPYRCRAPILTGGAL